MSQIYWTARWLLTLGALLISMPAVAASAMSLVAAARTQIGVTVIYDSAYVQMAFPGGDVPVDRGVCTDVVIRAYRTVFDFDLQKAVNADMRANFSAYPRHWGLRRTDSNIDHRRVPNLQVFFRRKGQDLSVNANPAVYQPGDLITQILPGNLPHIGIISDRKSVSGVPLVIHNIGHGVKEEDSLFSYRITGHYRFSPE
ncbi:MAG: DUF1287 domain-containing protein [Azonexus sp.]|nr:DUF1287 domain-containing protein [Azonexus sp.]